MGRQLRIHSVLMLALMGYASAAGATDVWHASTIRLVYPLSGGGFILVFTNTAPTCMSLSNYHNIAVGENGMTDAGLKNLYAAALAAAASEKVVSFNFDDSTSHCYINRLYVNYDT